MKKKALATGLVMAMMLTISACGSKNTTGAVTTAETTTAAETTTVEETTTEEITTEGTTTEESAGTEESTVTAEGAESEVQEGLTDDQIKSFAEEIQAAVASQDISWLADLVAYPVYVSLEVGEGSEIQSKEEFLAIDKEKLFTEKLMKQIADVNPEELEMFGAGIIMGEDINITFNNVNGEPAITGINL